MRYLTISFSTDDCLYDICKKLGSSKIKEVIGIRSYRDLVNKAKAEDRALGNYIKYKLKNSLS